MGSLTLLGALAALLLGATGLYRKSAVRSTARFVLAVFFFLFALATAALLYASFALADRGGGVMFFFALPLGIVAWIMGYSLFSSLQHESYYDKTTDEKIAHNQASLDQTEAALRASIARMTDERGKFWTSSKRRAELADSIAREREILGGLAHFRTALRRPETYEGDEP